MPLSLSGSMTHDGANLERHIQDFAVASGRTIKEETRTVFKGMVRDVFDYTPPAGKGAQGVRAKRVGELAVTRDVGRMGFTPVTIKGFRIITKVFGHPITHQSETSIYHGYKKIGMGKGIPVLGGVRVPTKLNPKFADPAALHRERLASKHGGKVSRGGKQGFYADRTVFKPLLKKWIDSVGEIASGWVTAAVQLAVTVPAFIKRHAGSGRGTTVQIVETASNYSMRVVNRFPDTADSVAAETERRIETFIKPNAVRRLQRQLKAKMAGLWGKTKRG